LGNKDKGFQRRFAHYTHGEIKKVTNHSRGNKTVVVDIPLPYRVDVNKFLKRRTKFAEVFRKNLTL